MTSKFSLTSYLVMASINLKCHVTHRVYYLLVLYLGHVLLFATVAREEFLGSFIHCIKSDYISSQVETEDNCEIIWSRVNLNKNKSFLLCSYYRPPNNNYNSISGLQNSMQQLTKDINNKFVILGGDFNLLDINWEDRTVKNNMCKSILDLMDDFSLKQLVNEPTKGNNTLDLCLQTSCLYLTL